MADLRFIGRILGGLGGIIMIIFGIIYAVNELATLALDFMGLDLTAAAQFLGDDANWLVIVAIMIVCGIVAILGYKELAHKDKGNLLLWGVIYIVLAIIGGGIGALLVLIGGIVLIIDYFV